MINNDENSLFGLFTCTDYLSPIDETVFLGSAETAKKEKLQQHGITYVINAANELDDELPSTIQYLKLPLTDKKNQDIKQHFDNVIQFINKAKNNKTKVLIHCMYGASRSATLVAAWLMHQQHQMGQAVNTEAILQFMEKQRAIINPNSSFREQLKRYEIELNNQLSLKQQLNLI